MNAPTIVARFLALYFFLAGCLQTALYICTQDIMPLTGFISGLVSQSWPLAVAAALFVLLDIQKKQGVQGMKHIDEDDEEEIPEAPLKGGSGVRNEEQISYFNINSTPISFASAPGVQGQSAEPQQNTVPRPEPTSAGQTLFATPPPFQQVRPSQQAAMGSAMPLPPAGSGNATVPIHSSGAPAPQAQAMPPAPPASSATENAEQQGGLSFFKL